MPMPRDLCYKKYFFNLLTCQIIMWLLYFSVFKGGIVLIKNQIYEVFMNGNASAQLLQGL